MRCRNTTMIFLVTTALMASLVGSWPNEVTGEDRQRSRRDYLRRRVLDRLAKRGLTRMEQEAAADLLVSRLLSASDHKSHSRLLKDPLVTEGEELPPQSQWQVQDEGQVYYPSVDLAGEWDLGEEAQVDSLWSPYTSEGKVDLAPLVSTQPPEFFLGEAESPDIVDSPISENMPMKTVVTRQKEKIKKKNKRRNEGKEKLKGKRQQKEDKKKKRREKKKRLKKIMDDDEITLYHVEDKAYIDCCPSKRVVFEKKVGKNRTNHAVDIKPNHNYFYERICLPDLEGKECLFPPGSLRPGFHTRCYQEYSFVRAHIRTYNRTNEEWKLDYIHVRSGCSCQVDVAPKKDKR